MYISIDNEETGENIAKMSINPEVINKLKKDLKDLIEAIYEISCVGGALHIVLDDGNLKDKDIQWCIDNSIKQCDNIVERVLCLECAKLLLSLPYELRDEWTRGE